MTRDPRQDRWVLGGTAVENPAVRLFCFPYAGAGASVFLNWANELPPQTELCSIQYPGRETRLAEPPLDRMEPLVENLVEALLPRLDCPFIFFGYSMGGIVAFETARRLRAAGHSSPRCLCIAAARPPQTLPAGLPSIYLSDRYFLQEVQDRYGEFPPELREHPEWLEWVTPLLRADISVLQHYRYEPEAPLQCPLALFYGNKDPELDDDTVEGWRVHAGGGFELRVFAGGHFFLREDRANLLAELSGKMCG